LGFMGGATNIAYHAICERANYLESLNLQTL